MKSRLFHLALIPVLALGFTSCKKDKEDPKITITSPANHSEFEMGGSFSVAATFEDDRELKSYSVMIGDEDGGHTHDFHFEQEKDITGESHDYSTTIAIPDSIDHVYYLHFKVTDAEDKTASDQLMLHFVN